ncbi:M48 family metalloprotease [Caulobacter sp. NIBR1757]|uniref:M48 family metalloprotease n=1 Tax=Caulobacter sp. NIBR1757 TaxID=3016000 RepID=UPI0022F03C9B|nr:M48 family metalloprotease [Caulobacter sp. NIBR1757]WGM39592.1 Beta-barrel assembly-enhancing protease [Caulobacter sp. NIBR1757]
MSSRAFSPWKPLRAAICGLTAASLVLSAGLPAFAQDDRVSLLRDTEIEEILHAEADPLIAAAGMTPKDVTILLVGDKSLNAFATQGQVLGFNAGLILETENPNQLKGVMAHEVGHLAGAHPLRSGDMQNAGLRPMLLTMGLGVLAMLAGAPDAGAMLIGNSGYFGTLGALGFSREQEGRADQAAVGFLEKTGQSSKGLVEFFDKFRYQEVFQEARRFPYFRSHPLSSERIEMLRARVEQQPHYNVVDSPADIERHEIMKAKIVAFTQPQVALIKYGETDKSYPARYARAIAYYRMKDVNRAVGMVDALLTEQPENAYLWELKGQMLFEFARAKEAEYPQRQSVKFKPDAPLLRINLGQTLINLDDPVKRDEGIEMLKRSLLHEDIPDAWRLLAQAYDAKGEEGLARLSTAEYYYSLGGLTEARGFAMRARDLLDKNSIGWRRATDIVLTANPSREDLKDLAKEGVMARP